MDSFADVPGKRYSPAFLNHCIGNLRGGHTLPQLHTAEPDLWDPATLFVLTQGCQKCDHSQGCWMDWWAHQSCDLSHMHHLHQKIAGLATPIQGPMDTGWQVTQLLVSN